MNLRSRIALGVAFVVLVATTTTTFAQKGYRPYTPPRIPTYTPPVYNPSIYKPTYHPPTYTPVRSHAEILAERQHLQANILRTQIPQNPLQGFQKLGHTSELTTADRIALIEQAGVILAQRAKSTNQPLKLLQEVRTVQKKHQQLLGAHRSLAD